jgi:hypothetical protein
LYITTESLNPTPDFVGTRFCASTNTINPHLLLDNRVKILDCGRQKWRPYKLFGVGAVGFILYPA